MSMKKIAFLLALGLCTSYSATSLAADAPAAKPPVKPSAQSATQDALKGGMMDHKMCDHMKGMMAKPDGGRMGGMMSGEMVGTKTGQMCDHMRGMKGGHECAHMSGGMGGAKNTQMCDHMQGMKGDHECAHMSGSMGGTKTNQMCDHTRGMKGEQACGHMGMRGGHEAGAMMESPHIAMASALDLSDEQRSKINKLSDELRHNNWAAKGLIMDQSAKLRDLYGADKRDPSAIGREYQKIFDLKRKMIEAMIDTQNRVEEILTPEQRTQLKGMPHKMAPMRCNPGW